MELGWAKRVWLEQHPGQSLDRSLIPCCNPLNKLGIQNELAELIAKANGRGIFYERPAKEPNRAVQQNGRVQNIAATQQAGAL